MTAATNPSTLILLSAPPRHGKTVLTGHYTPAWSIGNWPDRRVIYASYEASFAAKSGRRARDILTEWGGPVFGVRVRGDSKAADSWDVEGHDGGMETAGVGGPIIGKGADLFLIDDSLKNAEEALSPTIRQKQVDWAISTATTRLEPGASMVNLMQRWHTDDLYGVMEREFKGLFNQCYVLRMPALAEADDLMGRKPGEALWPERYSARYLERRQKLHPLWFAAQYQGRPVPLGGVLFKSEWFKTFRWLSFPESAREGYILGDTGRMVHNGDCVTFAFCDPSLGQVNSDRCAIGVFAVTPDGKILVLFMVSERIPVENIVPRLKVVAETWGCDFAGIEDNAFQVLLLKAARNKLAIPVRGLDPKGKKKLARATTVIEIAAAGDVYLPESAPWVAPFLEELCNWTGDDGDKDDQVDVCGYCGLEAIKYRGEDDEGPVAGEPRYAGGPVRTWNGNGRNGH